MHASCLIAPADAAALLLLPLPWRLTKEGLCFCAAQAGLCRHAVPPLLAGPPSGPSFAQQHSPDRAASPSLLSDSWCRAGHFKRRSDSCAWLLRALVDCTGEEGLGLLFVFV